MLSFCDGFDLVDEGGALAKYDLNYTFLQASVVAGAPGPPNSGPDGLAYFLFNTSFGFADFTHIWDSGLQTTVGFSMALQVNVGGTGGATNPVGPIGEWFRFGNPSGTQVTLKFAGGGHLEILAPSGLLIATAAYTFINNTFYQLEMKTGQHGYEMRVNGATVAHGGSITSASYDRATFRMAQGGPPGIVIDNFVLWDDRPGDGYADFIGPVKITTLFPIANINQAWAPSGTTPQQYLALRDKTFEDPNGAPDGDASYLTPTAVTPQLVSMSAYTNHANVPCYGKILSVAFNACARTIGVDSILQFQILTKATPHVVGQVTIGPWVYPTNPFNSFMNGFVTRQVIAAVSPESGSTFVANELQNAQFGLKITAGNENMRVSQFYIEIITSLDGGPYSCGGASYSY